MLSRSIIDRWPGKSPASSGGPFHPAIYHMLDVAAVAEILLRHTAFTPQQQAALSLLTALHDLGKIGTQFRNCILRSQAQQGGPHWEVTYFHLLENDLVLEGVGPANSRWRGWLYAATAGHHGRPPDRDLKRIRFYCSEEAKADARQVICAFKTLWPQASLHDLENVSCRMLSWWLPGLVATADWIGSSTDWFPPTEAGPEIDAYLERARDLAARAVKEAGFSWPALSLDPVFPHVLRPMQQACADIPLRTGPMLAIIEDETGAGKTEAALILAQRMMQAGKGDGLYFGLPSMATANAMLERLDGIVGRLFTSSPSLTLAHGRAAISRKFRDIVFRSADNPDEPGCAPWLAERRIRALLADIGIGTIDQALLGILPTRHNSLRLYGLSRKILIVDEAHELGDPYMAELLEGLLSAHAAFGGSAILLTATLPLPLRNRMSSAFETGAGRTPVMDNAPDYPALTIAGAAAVRSFPVRQQTGKGPVTIRNLSEQAAVLDVLHDGQKRGAASVWIRNSVDEAIAARDMLQAAGIPADLLHARFALCDRISHETAALAHFGRDSVNRQGAVLVATQIMEASLDCDFDIMVSDLAPMAALVQRMGRLWRHMDKRPASSRVVSMPILHVLCPNLNQADGEGWLKPLLGKGAYVYPIDEQWRTAHLLAQTGRISSPDDLRGLIEAVHGDRRIPLPEVIEQAAIQRNGKGLAAGATGRRNRLALDKADFRSGAGNWQDSEFPTRLGQDQQSLMLARSSVQGLVPWAEAETLVDREMLSSLQAAAARLAALKLPDQKADGIERFKSDWPDWKQRQTTVLPVADDGQICQGLRYERQTGLIWT